MKLNIHFSWCDKTSLQFIPQLEMAFKYLDGLTQTSCILCLYHYVHSISFLSNAHCFSIMARIPPAKRMFRKLFQQPAQHIPSGSTGRTFGTGQIFIMIMQISNSLFFIMLMDDIGKDMPRMSIMHDGLYHATAAGIGYKTGRTLLVLPLPVRLRQSPRGPALVRFVDIGHDNPRIDGWDKIPQHPRRRSRRWFHATIGGGLLIATLIPPRARQTGQAGRDEDNGEVIQGGARHYFLQGRDGTHGRDHGWRCRRCRCRCCRCCFLLQPKGVRGLHNENDTMFGMHRLSQFLWWRLLLARSSYSSFGTRGCLGCFGR